MRYNSKPRIRAALGFMFLGVAMIFLNAAFTLVPAMIHLIDPPISVRLVRGILTVIAWTCLFSFFWMQFTLILNALARVESDEKFVKAKVEVLEIETHEITSEFRDIKGVIRGILERERNRDEGCAP
jgi:hypothetical protein